MNAAIDIQAQLKEAWENAELGTAGAHDLIVVLSNNIYSVGTAIDLGRDGVTDERILERAKPEAHEWEAVVASYVLDKDHRREVYFRTEDGHWESDNYIALDGDLVDPVPLVEMPERAELVELFFHAWRGSEGDWPGSDPLADAVLELLRGEGR